MPRSVAGDDEKKAKRACGAAAINACLKSKRSRLIIAKTKDRKVGELSVVRKKRRICQRYLSFARASTAVEGL